MYQRLFFYTTAMHRAVSQSESRTDALVGDLALDVAS